MSVLPCHCLFVIVLSLTCDCHVLSFALSCLVFFLVLPCLFVVLSCVVLPCNRLVLLLSCAVLSCRICLYLVFVLSHQRQGMLSFDARMHPEELNYCDACFEDPLVCVPSKLGGRGPLKRFGCGVQHRHRWTVVPIVELESNIIKYISI